MLEARVRSRKIARERKKMQACLYRKEHFSGSKWNMNDGSYFLVLIFINIYTLITI